MEDWTIALFETMLQQIISRDICSAGELVVLLEHQEQPTAWWSYQLTLSAEASDRLIAIAQRAAPKTRLPVTTLSEAIATLGHERAREIIFRGVADKVFPARGPDQRRIVPHWRHAVAVAAGSACIAHQWDLPIGELFLAGLLHDVGQLVLFHHAGEPYMRLVRRFEGDSEHGDQIYQERRMLGFDHARLGAAIVERWGVTAAVRCLVRDHHQLSSLTSDSQVVHYRHKLAALVLAERIVAALGYGAGGDSINHLANGKMFGPIVESLEARVLDLSSSRLKKLVGGIEAQVLSTLAVAREGEGTLWPKPAWPQRFRSWMRISRREEAGAFP